MKGGTGCQAVYTTDYSGSGLLFGAYSGYYACYSKDNGETWNKIGTIGTNVDDMAYDYNTKTLFIVSGGILYTVDFSNPDAGEFKFKTAGCGSGSVTSVCIDPEKPNIVYVGTEDMDRGVIRSLDSGKTWTVLTMQSGEDRVTKGPAGGRVSDIVRVNANTGELFTAGGCTGVYKIPRPAV